MPDGHCPAPTPPTSPSSVDLEKQPSLESTATGEGLHGASASSPPRSDQPANAPTPPAAAPAPASDELLGVMGKVKEELSGATGKEEQKEELSGTAGKEEEEQPVGDQDMEEGEQLDVVSDMSSSLRWHASYSTLLLRRRKRLHKGTILLLTKVNHVRLLDADGIVIDARILEEGESIYPGLIFEIICFEVEVGECIEDEAVVAPGQQPPSKRYTTKQERRDEKKRKWKKLEEIRKESDEEERETHLPVSAEKIDGDLLSGADERGANKEKQPSSKRTKVERRDEKRRKRLQDADMRKDEKRRKRLKRLDEPMRSPGVKMVRSPIDMFAIMRSLRNEMSPQARKSVPIVTTHFPSPMAPSSRSTLSRGTARKQRKLKSKIWKEVVPIYKQGKLVEGQCKHCNDIFAASRSSGTNHIHRHLRTCKTRTRMHELVAKMSASASSPQVADLGKWEFSQEKSRRELANMVALHEFPFSIVEYNGFQKFVKSLNPLFKLVSRTTVKEDVMEAFREQRSALREELKNCGSRVSLTADMWTSNQRLGYLCVTCHFIDKSWKIQKRIIRFSIMETPHDGVQMYNVMLKSIQYWNIEDKICSITLDNASVNGSMMDNLRKLLDKKHLLICGGAIFHIRCAAHVLNLIVQDGLRVMEGVIDNTRESVKYIRSSKAREKLFEDVVEKLGMKCNKKPTLDVSSRWNTTYLMIDSSLPYKEAFVELEKQDRQFIYAPLKDEWDMAEAIRKLLETFWVATKVVSGSSYPTSNRYFHEIWNVKLLLKKHAKSKNKVIGPMVSEMQIFFDKYWKESYLANCIPVILDPRYKYGFVEFRLKQAYGNDVGEHLKKVDKVIKDLFEEYSREMGDSVAASSDEEFDVDMKLEADNPLVDWEAHLKVQKKQVTTELDRYLSEDLFPQKKDFDILSWWKMHAPKYPVLSCIARDVLAVQASNVASESAFSTGGRVVSDYRSRLTSDTVEALICLQDWLRAADSSCLKTTTPTALNDEHC